MTTRSDYDTVSDGLNLILEEFCVFQGELWDLRNPNSPLDQRLAIEFMEEVRKAQEVREAEFFATHGWTKEEFCAELDRRLFDQAS